jgi:hypothetical protein
MYIHKLGKSLNGGRMSKGRLSQSARGLINGVHSFFLHPGTLFVHCVLKDSK